MIFVDKIEILRTNQYDPYIVFYNLTFEQKLLLCFYNC